MPKDSIVQILKHLFLKQHTVEWKSVEHKWIINLIERKVNWKSAIKVLVQHLNSIG